MRVYRALYSIVAFGLSMPLLCHSQTGPYAIGAAPTDLVRAMRPTTIQELRRLHAQSSLQAALAPGVVEAIPQAHPSNALLGRVNRYNWTVFAYDVSTGSVVPFVDMVLQPLRHEANSGGHDHDSASRPKGDLSAYGGNTGPSGLDLNIQYTSPEVAGKVFSDSSCTGPNGFACFPGQYYSFTTKVPSLVELGADPTYDLIGSTVTHRSNHWGTASFLAKLRDAATLYYLRYAGQASPRLAINDISLATGGLFDIGANWTRPHAEHRIGVVADLRVVPVERIAALRRMLQDVGINGRVLIHVPPDPPHWHIREYDSGE
jgi:hypothetical protein